MQPKLFKGNKTPFMQLSVAFPDSVCSVTKQQQNLVTLTCEHQADLIEVFLGDTEAEGLVVERVYGAPHAGGLLGLNQLQASDQLHLHKGIQNRDGGQPLQMDNYKLNNTLFSFNIELASMCEKETDSLVSAFMEYCVEKQLFKMTDLVGVK